MELHAHQHAEQHAEQQTQQYARQYAQQQAQKYEQKHAQHHARRQIGASEDQRDRRRRELSATECQGGMIAGHQRA